jgi:hypothetical protein
MPGAVSHVPATGIASMLFRSAIHLAAVLAAGILASESAAADKRRSLPYRGPSYELPCDTSYALPCSDRAALTRQRGRVLVPYGGPSRLALPQELRLPSPPPSDTSR